MSWKLIFCDYFFLIFFNIWERRKHYSCKGHHLWAETYVPYHAQMSPSQGALPQPAGDNCPLLALSTSYIPHTIIYCYVRHHTAASP